MYGTACCIQLTKNSKFDIDLSFEGSGSDQAVAKCACGNINGPKHKKELRTSIFLLLKVHSHISDFGNSQSAMMTPQMTSG